MTMKATTLPNLSRPVSDRVSRASLLGVGYALFCYAAFQASFSYYFIGFLNNFLVPKGVDDGAITSVATAVAFDVGLVLLWGIQHSVMARPKFKQIWTRIIPAHTERATYVLASALSLSLVMAFWVPVGGTVWQVQSLAGKVAIWTLAAVGWGFLLAASFEIDHFELFGVKQPLAALRGRSLEPPAFQAKRIYRIVRHPIQTGVLVGMWATPDMTVSHALFAGLMTLYVFVGLHFEERQLMREHGEQYAEYKRNVARLIPFGKGL